MADYKKENKRRMWWFYIIILAAALVTAISSFSQAGTNRPLRYYTDNGTTAMTYYTSLDNNTTVSGWGINTDYPVCEFQVGDNGSANWLCMNKSNYYTCTGTTCTAVSGGGAPSSAEYVTLSSSAGLSSERVLTAGRGITLVDTGANGIIRVNVTTDICSTGQVSKFNGTSFECVTDTTGNGSGGSNVSFVNALNGYPLKMNGTSDITIFNVSCDYFNGGSNSGYGFIDINNNSGCGLFLKSEIDGSITNEIQNLWATINGNTGSTTASTSTDTLTIQGSGGTHVSISGDTVTITSNVSISGGGVTSIANDGYILYQKNGTIINGTVMFYNESTGQIVLPVGSLTFPTIVGSDPDSGAFINGSEIFFIINAAQKLKVNANGIALNDGTTSAYAYAFQSDVNTGMRLIRADNLGIGTGGSDALDINNTIIEANRNMTVRGDLNITSITYAQDIVPRQNNTYDLGSTTRYWRDLYLSNGTIFMNGWTIKADTNNLYYNGAALATLSYAYRIEASLNATNITANTASSNAASALTSIGYLNSTKANAGSCGTGNTVIQNATSTGVECIAMSTGSGDGNNYTYAQEVNQSGNTYTLYTYRNGIATPLSSSFTVTSGNGSSSPGGSAGTIQFKNSTSGFDGNSNVTIDETNGNLNLNSEVDVKYLRMDNVSAPTAPTTGDRVLIHVSNKTGIPRLWASNNMTTQPYSIEGSLATNYQTYCYPQASTVMTCIGTTQTINTGTGSTIENIGTFGRMHVLTTGATAQNTAASSLVSSSMYRNAGYRLVFGGQCFPSASYGSGSTGSIYFGGGSTLTARANMTQDGGINTEAAGFYYSTNASDTTFSFITQTTTSRTKTDTTLNFTTGNCYYMEQFAPKGGDRIYWYIKDLNASIERYGYVTSNLPSGTSAMTASQVIRTLTTTAKVIHSKQIYIEYFP